jgi:hypothetical protein
LTIVDLPIPDDPVITTNDLFLTSSNMVATAEVSKNVSFFQLSISSVNTKKDLFENKRNKILYNIVRCKFEPMAEWVIYMY